jgi:hypothetical protein
MSAGYRRTLLGRPIAASKVDREKHSAFQTAREAFSILDGIAEPGPGRRPVRVQLFSRLRREAGSSWAAIPPESKAAAIRACGDFGLKRTQAQPLCE